MAVQVQAVAERPHFPPHQGKSWAQIIPTEKGVGSPQKRPGPAHRMGCSAPQSEQCNRGRDLGHRV